LVGVLNLIDSDVGEDFGYDEFVIKMNQYGNCLNLMQAPDQRTNFYAYYFRTQQIKCFCFRKQFE